jgi:hypothetical protein
MKKTAPTEVGGCMVEGGQEAILEILDGSLVPLKSRKSLVLWRVMVWLSSALGASAVDIG